MCKYCNNMNAFDEPVLDKEIDLGVLKTMGVMAAIHKDGELLVSVTHDLFNDIRKFDNEWSLRIKYCPFCGREF